MANGCSTSLVINEMQSKTTMRYHHFTSAKIAIIKMTENNKFCEDKGKWQPSHTADGNVKGCIYFGKQSFST